MGALLFFIITINGNRILPTIIFAVIVSDLIYIWVVMTSCGSCEFFLLHLEMVV